MENSELFIIKNWLKSFELGGYIPSNSEQGKFHFVYLLNDKWNCDCVASSMGHECSHIKAIKEKIKTIK